MNCAIAHFGGVAANASNASDIGVIAAGGVASTIAIAAMWKAALRRKDVGRPEWPLIIAGFIRMLLLSTALLATAFALAMDGSDSFAVTAEGDYRVVAVARDCIPVLLLMGIVIVPIECAYVLIARRRGHLVGRVWATSIFGFCVLIAFVLCNPGLFLPRA